MASSISWLHCNNCGALPVEKDNDISRFSIAGCGHVFCNECVSMSALSCFVCQHAPFYPRAIDSNLSPQLKSLFTPPRLVFRHVLERVQDVVAFQWAQFELSRALLQQNEYATHKSEQDNKSNTEINAELSEEIADLEACIRCTQRQLSAVQNVGNLNSMTSRAEYS
uniref:RING-type domain-containing protein n=1 Tax=Parascaris univalens TaxID=6257 RepID=A0A915BTS2_PARUN